MLARASPAKTSAGSTTMAIGAPKSTSSPVWRASSTKVKLSVSAVEASLAEVIQAIGLPSSSRLKTVHSAIT